MKIRGKLSGLVRGRLSALIPALFVIAVLAGSFFAPRPSLKGSLLDFGYGYSPAPAQYHPLTPARIFDTRNGTGGAPGKLGPQSAFDIQVTGKGGVPASATVQAVAINVTATNGTAGSFLTVYPNLVPRPNASTNNWRPGETDANLVKVNVNNGGKISIYNQAGTVDVIVDVEGYWATQTTPNVDGLYNPIVPNRVLDTRIGQGAPAAKVGPGQAIDVQVTGTGSGATNVPASGQVEAVALNLTAVNATAGSFVTAYPTGATRPFASSVNFLAGQTKPNRVIVMTGTGGKITLYNQAGSVDLIVDLSGWFTTAQVGAHGSVFVGQPPNRLLDTRTSGGPLGQNSTLNPLVSGQAGVPNTNVRAVVLNVTAVAPTATSFLTIWPSGSPQPFASDLNFVPGQTVPNLVIVELGPDGKINIYNKAGNTHVVVDVMGWLAGP